MIINRAHKFVFVHVPKTAGQSVWRFFPREKPSTLRKRTGKAVKLHYDGHMPYFRMREILDIDDYFSFGFTRNPWDRMVSFYHFVCQKTHNDKEEWNQEEIKKIGFKKWLLEYPIFNYEDRNYEDPPRLQERDCFWWLDGVEYIGRFETIKQDVEIIREMLNTRKTVLEKMNSSNHDHYRKYYDSETEEFIRKHHFKTIEKMGYTF